MKRSIVFVLILLLFAGYCFAEQFQTAVDRSGIDINTIKNLMKTGQMLIIEEKPDGTLKMVTAGIVINEPPAKVYETLVQYDKYHEYMPSTVECRIVKDDGNTKDVFYKISFKFSVLKWEVEYTLRQTFVANKEIRWKLLESKGDKLKETDGAWQLFSLPGGKTAAFYSAYSDLKSISWVIRKALEADPSMELAVNASACVMVIKALKNRMEKPNYAPNLKNKM